MDARPRNYLQSSSNPDEILMWFSDLISGKRKKKEKEIMMQMISHNHKTDSPTIYNIYRSQIKPSKKKKKKKKKTRTLLAQPKFFFWLRRVVFLASNLIKPP
jgi:hypothetical protein